MATSVDEFPPLPLVGRSDELAALRTAIDRTAVGRGGTLFLTGPPGAGKTRLAQAIRDEAERRDFLVAAGAAYPLEATVPYAIFCDLLDPLVRDEPADVLVGWTRGAPEFQLLCPSLSADGASAPAGGSERIPDPRNRLLWNLPSFLDRVRRDRPLLLVMEDLQWADPSSLELLHFLGRRSHEHPFLIVGTFRGREPDTPVDAGELARGLQARAQARVLELAPLGVAEVREAVSRAFDVAPEVVGEFSAALHRWTGGNPFFVRSMLESHLASGRLRREGGRWVGWTLDEPGVPISIRDLVRDRLAPLSAPARRVAELAAVAGARTPFDLLREASGIQSSQLLSVIGELQERRILEETREGDDVGFRFIHPVVRSVLYAELGLARARLLHIDLARTLERMHGEGGVDHASELAAHLLHGAGEVGVVDRPRAARYLAAAGRRALAARGNREAAEYLEAALRFLPPGREGGTTEPDRYTLLMDLTRARQRLGQHDAAEGLLLEARALAEANSDPAGIARVDRRLGLNMFWARRLPEAVDYWSRGLKGAREAGDPILEAKIRLDRCVCLHETGEVAAAGSDAREALRIGEEHGDSGIQQAAHRSLALLYTWTGPPGSAREHGLRALALAEEMADDGARFSTHRALAILEGLTGHPTAGRVHLEAASGIAERSGSPLLKLRIAEVRIEYCAALGEWDHGIDLAEESIRMARELNHHIALPRLLVWSGLLHLDRGDYDIATVQVAEAWSSAGLDDGPDPPAATHTAVLAHIGRAALHLASREFAEAIRVSERGMLLVERSGSRAWAIHRLLPIMGEAALHLRDLDRARAASELLRRESTDFDHQVGLAFADTCDALVTWLEGDVERGARQMAAAAERLEALDSVPYAARLRRQLAGRLAELGERDAAIRELRRVHELLSALGAEPELDRTRGQFREVGARPPVRGNAPGNGELTTRELEIARLVGRRRSNKAIGKELGISPRTVGTHLSNIFRKLELDSRVALGDLVRTGLLDEGM